MTHQDDASTYADLLARLGDDGTKELFRRLLEQALQDLIDAELTAHISADGDDPAPSVTHSCGIGTTHDHNVPL